MFGDKEREKVRAALRARKEKLCADPALARAWCVDVLRTHNADGSLTAEYGGERTDPRPVAEASS